MAHIIYFQNTETQIQSQSLMGEEELENEDLKKLLSTLMEGLESQLDPGFFQDDDNVKKSKKNSEI